MREALQEHGVKGELIVISDGASAVHFIDALNVEPCACPDLVIIDLNLPKAPGFEVLKRMRQCARCKDATVVILSSSEAISDKTEARRLGATHYLRKPLRLDDFLQLGAVFKSILEEPGQALD